MNYIKRILQNNLLLIHKPGTFPFNYFFWPGPASSEGERSFRKLFISTGEGSTHRAGSFSDAKFILQQGLTPILEISGSDHETYRTEKTVVKSDFYLSEREHSPNKLAL